jgi:hypothetical protein
MKKKIGTSKSLKRYEMAGSVTGPGDDLLNKAKSLVKRGINKAERTGEQVYNKVKSKVPSSVKSVIKRGINAVDKKIQDVCGPDEEYCPYKKGGSVKSKKMKMGGSCGTPKSLRKRK